MAFELVYAVRSRDASNDDLLILFSADLRIVNWIRQRKFPANGRGKLFRLNYDNNTKKKKKKNHFKIKIASLQNDVIKFYT